MKILTNIIFPKTRLSQHQIKRFVEHKRILITGGTSGIGLELVRLLVEFSCDIHIVGRTSELLSQKEEFKMVKANLHWHQLDLRNSSQRANLLLMFQSFNFDWIVLNAGKSIRRSFIQTIKDKRFHDVTRTIELNYLANADLTIGLVEGLMKTSGHISLVSALNVKLFAPRNWSAYHASKIAAEQYFLAIRNELKDKGIGLTILYFPLVRTPMIKSTKAYENTPAMKPQQAAIKLIAGAIRKKRIYVPWWYYFIRPVKPIMAKIQQNKA